MKTSEILALAAPMLMTPEELARDNKYSGIEDVGKREYLCHAVDDLLEMKTIEPHEHAQTKAFVLDHLVGPNFRHSAYVGWLCATDPEMAALREKDVHALYIEAQRRKHEWVKQLIAEAIAKND